LLQKSSENTNRELYEMKLINEADDLGIKLIFTNLNFDYKEKTTSGLSKIETAAMYIFIKEK